MNTDNGWRVEITREYSRFGGLAVYIWRKYDSGDVDFVLPIDPVVQRIPAGSDELAEFREPSLRLADHDLALALLNGLAAYFGGTSDVQRLHRDLNAERARVDKLTEAVIKIATANHG